MLELHCHTTCSDGTLTPTQLVKAAAASGVRALAITDHDTIAGWEEAMATAAKLNINIIPGIELSTSYNGRSLHILGYYPDPAKLEPPLHERLEGRHRRARQILAKLADLGYSIPMPELKGTMAPGRPHIARALVNAGHVQSAQEAFERWLRDDGPAYVGYGKFSAVEGIELLRSCDAVPVWAHPYLFRGGEVKELLPELVTAGLMGLEVYHPSHTPTQRQKLEQGCRQYNLLATGGSDYHGPYQDGNGAKSYSLNSLQLPLDLLPPLKEAAARLKAETCL